MLSTDIILICFEFIYMGKITFYQVMNGETIKAACIILEKCFKNNLKTFVQLGDEETKKLLNKNLWTFSQKSFIPHGSDEDPDPEKHPIYISCKDECPIDADCLMLIGKTRLDSDNYQRVLVMVDGTIDTDVESAQSMRDSLKNLGHNIEYYKQNRSGGWECVIGE